jgi:hypothetical protein
MALAKELPKEEEGQSKRRKVAIADTGSVDGRADEDRHRKKKKKKEVKIRT